MGLKALVCTGPAWYHHFMPKPRGPKFALDSDLKVVRADVATLKVDVSALKDDVASLKTDVKSLDSRTARLEGKMDKFAVALVHADVKSDTIKQELLDVIAANTSRILGAIDAFAQKGQSYDQKSITHGAILVDHTATLKDHSRRLTSLEAKP